MIFINSKKGQRLVICLLFLAIFAGYCAYFFNFHQLYIYDLDDWSYSSYNRCMWPVFGLWNPTKVFPEILMRWTCSVSLFFGMPINNDFVFSISIGTTIVLSAFIALYFSSYYVLFTRRFKLGTSKSLFLLVVIICFHMLPITSSPFGDRPLPPIQGDINLLYAADINCIFNYLIPTLLNFTLVILFLSFPNFKFFNRKHIVAKIFLVFALYLAAFSGMANCTIFAIFMGSKLLLGFISHCIKMRKVRSAFLFAEFFKTFAFEILYLILWAITILLEVCGGRARMDSNSKGFPIGETFVNFLHALQNLNCLDYILPISLLVISLIIFVYQAKKGKNCKNTKFSIKTYLEKAFDMRTSIYMIACLVICEIVELIFLMIVLTVIHPTYMLRAEFIFIWYFWIILISVIFFAYILNNLAKAAYILPVLCVFLFFCSFWKVNSFADYNTYDGRDSSVIKQLDDFYLTQILDATSKGQDKITLRVPDYPTDYWPINKGWSGFRMMNSLYTYGLVDKVVPVEIVFDKEVNERFNLE